MKTIAFALFIVFPFFRPESAFKREDSTACDYADVLQMGYKSGIREIWPMYSVTWTQTEGAVR